MKFFFIKNENYAYLIKVRTVKGNFKMLGVHEI